MNFIIQALEERALLCVQAQYIFSVDGLEDRWQIESSVQRLQELLELQIRTGYTNQLGEIISD